MRIFLTGGGTAGSVTPLLAIAEQLSDHQLWFIGTRRGVERDLVRKPLTYLSIPAGKFRRYFSLRNILDPLLIVVAFFKALYFMLRYRPHAVVSVGSFVAVPVIWAAWCCGVRTIVHQQDIRVGLSTHLTAPFATVLTKAFADIKLWGATWVGNPVRNLAVTTNELQIDPNYPTVLIFGGGTGAQALNDLVSPALCDLANIIHITGSGKPSAFSAALLRTQRYKSYDLLTTTMPEALQKADIVICRAGLGTISELAYLGKVAIVLPIPGTHQDDNAQLLARQQAAIVLDQRTLTPEALVSEVKELLATPAECAHLSAQIKQLMKPDSAQAIAQLITTTS